VQKAANTEIIQTRGIAAFFLIFAVVLSNQLQFVYICTVKSKQIHDQSWFTYYFPFIIIMVMVVAPSGYH
jgi:hypothetical protein